MNQVEIANMQAFNEFFRTSDARCPSCGYSLRGCESDRCPECGAAITLGVIVTRRVSTWWLAGVLGAALSVGMSIVLLWPGLELVAAILYNPMMKAQVRSGFAPMSTLPRWNTIWLLTIVMIFGCLTLAWLIASRPSFNRWTTKIQILAGGACLISPLIFLAINQIAARLL
jgi:hypothetical protein